MSSTNFYKGGVITCSLIRWEPVVVHSPDSYKKQRNKFKRMLLNEKLSGQSVLTRQIRRVPLTARPMDLIYFSFFAVSHYSTLPKQKKSPRPWQALIPLVASHCLVCYRSSMALSAFSRPKIMENAARSLRHLFQWPVDWGSGRHQGWFRAPLVQDLYYIRRVREREPTDEKNLITHGALFLP